MQEGGGVLLPGPLPAPPDAAKTPGLQVETRRVAYAARRTSPAKLSFAFSLKPETVGQAGRKQHLYTSVDADRPRISPPKRGKEFGGAAGNRTRVQSAYFVRVYPHSPANRTLVI